jgi:uncharacterized repeat protein (TIGR03803 family)
MREEYFMKNKIESRTRACRTLERFFIVIGCTAIISSPAQSYRILHAFGTNRMGINPRASLVQGPDGALYGTTEGGGLYNQGQVFRVNADGSGYTVLKDFSGKDGANPAAALTVSGATLYGTTPGGGTNGGNGTVFKLNTNGTGFAVLKHFNGDDGAWPQSGVVVSGTAIYGATYFGGDYQRGTVFKMNSDGSGFVRLMDFTDTNGFPGGVLLSDSTLYGTTYSGGAEGSGTVFKMNTDGSGFAQLKEFSDAEGAVPLPGLAFDGTTLYGTTGGGSVFSLKTNGADFAVLKWFTNSLDGEGLNGGLAVSGSALYGTTSFGGISNSGTLFRLSTDGNEFAVLCSFTNSNDGYEPYAGLISSGTTLYGTTFGGGAFGYGTVFKLRTDGSEYSRIADFSGGDGVLPLGIILSGETLYGITEGGGGSGNGTIFKINTNGNDYAVLKNFTNALDGAQPACRPLIDGSTIFGSARYGGSAWNGALFTLNTNGTGFAVLKDFADPLDGVNPSGELVLLGDTLYGTTGFGGSNNCGIIFRICTNGTGFKVLKNFAGSDGREPEAGLIASGAMLYGTTLWGGSNDCGIVFSINSSGENFSILKHFSGRDGSTPADLLLSNGTLYGTAGGGNGYGVVFKINTDGSGFESFNPFDWETRTAGPLGRLCLTGTTLLGVAIDDALFQINTDGSGFAAIKIFGDTNGYYPNAGVELSSSTAFGTTGLGGFLDCGVLYSLSLLPDVAEVPSSRTAEAGGSVSFFIEPTGLRPFDYQWLCNGTNDSQISATNYLLFSDLQLAQSGAYQVVLTNAFGSFTSAPVMLNVIPVVERRLVPGIKVSGNISGTWNVERSDVLAPADWKNLATLNPGSAPQYCFDTSQPLPSMRFYRAGAASGFEPVSLSLNFYPAITAAGAIGTSVRVDKINPIGPTDAWITLGTMTLTNTPQLFFDLTEIGHISQLYRIVPLP